MAKRVPFPEDVCSSPDARYYRTLAEAFPCGPREAIAVQRFEPPRAWIWIVLAVLVLGIGAGLSGCSTSDSTQFQPNPSNSMDDLKRAAAGAWLCPGMHAEWLNEKEVMCIKETK